MSTPTIPPPASPADASPVRAFIEGRVPGVTFADSDDIFALGIINSLFAVELVLFIEKAINGRVPNDELLMDNFRSVDAITGLTQRLRQGPRDEVAP